MSTKLKARTGLKRRTLHFGDEYEQAEREARTLSSPWTTASLIRETVRRNLRQTAEFIRSGGMGNPV